MCSWLRHQMNKKKEKKTNDKIQEPSNKSFIGCKHNYPALFLSFLVFVVNKELKNIISHDSLSNLTRCYYVIMMQNVFKNDNNSFKQALQRE